MPCSESRHQFTNHPPPLSWTSIVAMQYAREKRHLRQEMRLRSFNMLDVPADGACQFAAAADQLVHLGHAATAADVRQRAVAWLREHHAAREMQCPDEALSWPAYLDRMQRCKEWGDNATLVAISAAYDVHVDVISSRPAESQVVRLEPGSPGVAGNYPAAGTIVVGHMVWHYTSCRPAA